MVIYCMGTMRICRTNFNGLPGSVLVEKLLVRECQSALGSLDSTSVPVHFRLFKVFQVKGLFDQVDTVKVVSPKLVLFDHFGNQLVPKNICFYDKGSLWVI